MDNEELAAYLHGELCSEDPCRRWLRRDSPHREHYRGKAGVLLRDLLPLTGEADFMPVLRTVLREVVLCPSRAARRRASPSRPR